MKKTNTKIMLSLISVFALLLSITSLPNIKADTQDNEKYIYNYLKNEMSLNTAAASGILANIYAESTFRPDVYGDKGTSYGLVQWHGVRFRALKDYCSKKGYDYKSLDGQLSFLKYELENEYKKVHTALMKAKNSAQGAYDCAYVFCYDFEIPADRLNESKKRGKLAQNIYFNKYSAYTDSDSDDILTSDSDTDISVSTDSDDSEIIITALPGDVNCDGKISMLDVTSLQKVMAELLAFEHFGENSSANADFNGDNNIDMVDISDMQRYIAFG